MGRAMFRTSPLRKSIGSAGLRQPFPVRVFQNALGFALWFNAKKCQIQQAGEGCLAVNSKTMNDPYQWYFLVLLCF
jgi:hypothetical protein